MGVYELGRRRRHRAPALSRWLEGFPEFATVNLQRESPHKGAWQVSLSAIPFLEKCLATSASENWSASSSGTMGRATPPPSQQREMVLVFQVLDGRYRGHTVPSRAKGLV